MNTRYSTALRSAVALLCAWSLVVVPTAWGSVAWGQGAPPKPRIAVLEFESVGVSTAEAAAVSDQLRSDLVRQGHFTVVDRAQTQRVLGEMAFQQQGATDPNQAARIGKILNVEFIVAGRITALSGAYQVNSQLIRVETGVIERSESIVHQGPFLGLLSDNMSTIANRLAAVERPPSVASAAPAPPPAAESKSTGWPWWVWALIVVGVIGVAAAAGGGDSSSPPASRGTACCCSSAVDAPRRIMRRSSGERAMTSYRPARPL